MKNTKLNKTLFISSGCITEDALIQYCENSLRPIDKEAVENHLKICNICSDALEGYKILNDNKKFNDSVNRINQRIGGPLSEKITDLKVFLPLLIAASVTLIFIYKGLSNQFYKTDEFSKNRVLGSTINQNKEETYFRILNYYNTYEEVVLDLNDLKIKNYEELIRPGTLGKNKKIIVNDIIINQKNIPRLNDQKNGSFEKLIKERIEFLVKQNEIKGTCNLTAEFVINKEGRITNPKILTGCNSFLDNITLKVLEETPVLNPATVNNIPVDYPVRLFINSSN